MKLRLHSTKEENEKFIQLLKNTTDIDILSQSTPYSDRGKSVYERIYLDIAMKEHDPIISALKDAYEILNMSDKKAMKEFLQIFKKGVQVHTIYDELYISFKDVSALIKGIERYL